MDALFIKILEHLQNVHDSLAAVILVPTFDLARQQILQSKVHPLNVSFTKLCHVERTLVNLVDEGLLVTLFTNNVLTGPKDGPY